MLYSATSRFDTGGVTRDAARVVAVVPPPEVYFLCLAFHVPSKADLLSMAEMNNPTLRSMLTRVFDVRVDVEGCHSEGTPRTYLGRGCQEERYWVVAG